MPHLQEPVLTFAADNVSKMKFIDDQDISAMWTVFTKCKDGLENGRRLENMSWRLWYRSVHAGYSYSSGSDLSKSMVRAAEVAQVKMADGRKGMGGVPLQRRDGTQPLEGRVDQNRRDDIRVVTQPVPHVATTSRSIPPSPTSVSPSSVGKILNSVEAQFLPSASPTRQQLPVVAAEQSAQSANSPNELAGPVLRRTARTFGLASLYPVHDNADALPLISAALPSTGGATAPRASIRFFVSESDSDEDSSQSFSSVRSRKPAVGDTQSLLFSQSSQKQMQPQARVSSRQYKLACFDDNTEEEDGDDEQHQTQGNRRQPRNHDQGFDADSDSSESEDELGSSSFATTFDDEGLCFNATRRSIGSSAPPMFRKIGPTQPPSPTMQIPARSSALSVQIRSRMQDGGVGRAVTGPVDPRRREWTESVRSAVVWERRMPFGMRTDRQGATSDRNYSHGSNANDHLYW